MTFKQGLLLARSHIAFITGLVLALGLISYLEGWRPADFEAAMTGGDPGEVAETVALPLAAAPVARRATGALPPELSEWALHAWQYFENNYQSETGLVNSVDGYPSTTLWDTASYLMGLLSAKRLGLIGEEHFEKRLTSALGALERIPLVDGKAPNKVYDTRTLEMVDYTNTPTPEGIGWSAIDTARILVPLQIIVWEHPGHTRQVRRLVARWDFDVVVQEGTLYGAERIESGSLESLQEGRLGYEEYASKSFSLFGLDVGEALRYDDHLGVVDVDGVPIAIDSRDHETLGANNYVLSEPYVLDGVEFGFDHSSRGLATNVYLAQRERAKRTGLLTAVSETQLDRAPYFVYNTVYANGRAWNTITEENEDASAHRTLSTKAALGWYVLFDDEYSESLLEEISGLVDPDRGFFSGRYEKDGRINSVLTANTNGIILECLAYLQWGPLLQVRREPIESTTSIGRVLPGSELESAL